jgi:hypothetical protein
VEDAYPHAEHGADVHREGFSEGIGVGAFLCSRAFTCFRRGA